MSSSARAVRLAFLLLVASGCASTRLNYSLQDANGTLEQGRVHRAARIDVDRTFEHDPSARALILSAGDRTVLELGDAQITIYVALDPASVLSETTIASGELVPYAELRLDDFRAVCKGGRGEVRIRSATNEAIAGELAITVSCRTYLDGYEREETSLSLAGPFRLQN